MWGVILGYMVHEHCSCGEIQDHVVARRQTIDGKTVLFWSDGVVTFAMGYGIRGVGKSRSRWDRGCDRLANSWLSEMVCLLESEELGPAVRAARKLARKVRRAISWEMPPREAERIIYKEIGRFVEGWPAE